MRTIQFHKIMFWLFYTRQVNYLSDECAEKFIILLLTAMIVGKSAQKASGFFDKKSCFHRVCIRIGFYAARQKYTDRPPPTKQRLIIRKRKDVEQQRKAILFASVKNRVENVKNRSFLFLFGIKTGKMCKANRFIGLFDAKREECIHRRIYILPGCERAVENIQ